MVKLQEFGVTSDLQVTIEGKLQTVSLSVQYYSKIRHYYISAVTECGFELCNEQTGYLKSSVERVNTRLRSEFSIANDALAILESLERSVTLLANDVILTERTVKGQISGSEVYLDNVRGIPFSAAINIHSIQSGLVLAWHSHDVFNQGPIDVTVYRTSEGYLHLRANESALYDTTKLQTLHDSDAFQNSKYAFFNYNECRRLLGMPVKGNPKRMSGLFYNGIQE